MSTIRIYPTGTGSEARSRSVPCAYAWAARERSALAVAVPCVSVRLPGALRALALRGQAGGDGRPYASLSGRGRSARAIRNLEAGSRGSVRATGVAVDDRLIRGRGRRSGRPRFRCGRRAEGWRQGRGRRYGSGGRRLRAGGRSPDATGAR